MKIKASLEVKQLVSRELDKLIKQADKLAPEEQLRLIAHLAQKARQAYRGAKPRPQWSEIAGAAPYPMVGEDAQQWVSRTRSESDKQREDQWSKS